MYATWNCLYMDSFHSGTVFLGLILYLLSLMSRGFDLYKIWTTIGCTSIQCPYLSNQNKQWGEEDLAIEIPSLNRCRPNLLEEQVLIVTEMCGSNVQWVFAVQKDLGPQIFWSIMAACSDIDFQTGHLLHSVAAGPVRLGCKTTILTWAYPVSDIYCTYWQSTLEFCKSYIQTSKVHCTYWQSTLEFCES